MSVIKRILYLQHSGIKTRLCDVTVNPLVALYFAIEDETQDDKDAVVFIIDKSKEIYIDSIELQTIINTSCNLDNIYSQIREAVKGISFEDYVNIITHNYLVKYDIELAYSNSRAMLQGGTVFCLDLT